MSLEADYLNCINDKTILKKKIRKWKIIAIIAVVILFFIGIYSGNTGTTRHQHIARITIDEIITEDRDVEQTLAKIANDSHVEAVILHVNSPGGTMVGGESLYYALKKVAAKKPLVTVMGSVAASGGYMVALPSHQIFASEGTLTGSIGVLFQSAEFVDLSKKLGINFVTYKSGELKGAPSPFEKINDNVSAVMHETIAETYDIFVNMVADSRHMKKEDVLKIADGRIYIGRKALELGLIDAIGREDEAVNWLEKNKGIKKDLVIEDWKLKKEPEGFAKLFEEKIFGGDFIGSVNKLTGLQNIGLLALWHE